MDKVKIAVCGATGYAGIELLRILSNHPAADVRVITSESKKAKKCADVNPDLTSFSDMRFKSLDDTSIYNDVDLAFLALPHEPAAHAAAHFLDNGVRVIDLSAAYRIKDLAVFEKTYRFKHPHPELVKEAVYGLCEIYRDKIKTARLIANPGCYTTASLLPLIPLFKQGILVNKTVIIDAKSGYSGAGKKVNEGSLFVEVNENFFAYAIGTHRHRPEIAQELGFAAGNKIATVFTPHVVPMDRGILSTIYLPEAADKKEAVFRAWKTFYKNSKSIHITEDTLPRTKWVAHTDKVMMSAATDEETGTLILVSAIDNLRKGAAGQAVQNMNLMFDMEEMLGLRLG